MKIAISLNYHNYIFNLPDDNSETIEQDANVATRLPCQLRRDTLLPCPSLWHWVSSCSAQSLGSSISNWGGQWKKSPLIPASNQVKITLLLIWVPRATQELPLQQR